MLKIIYYEKNLQESLDKIDFSSTYVAICPSPQKADIFREILIDAGVSEKVTVTTISNFIKTNLSEEDVKNMKSKSDLLLEFWTLWKIKIDKDYSRFRFVYDLFTDIRSYSVNFGIIEELRPYITQEEYLGIELFWNYLETTDKIDEQKSYHLIKAQKNQENLIFWGYDHLNANQIDFIKSISEDREVLLPLSKRVAHEAGFLDWPKWLDVEIDKEYESQKIEVKTISIPEGKIAQYLNGLRNINKVNTFLISSAIDFFNYKSVAIKDTFFKVQLDYFKSNVDEFFYDLQNKDLSKIDHEIEHYLEAAYKNKKIKAFKIYSQFKTTINDFRELSDSNMDLILEDLKCLKEKLLLDLPRISLLSLNQEFNQKILTAEYLSLPKYSRDSYVYINKEMASSFQESIKYTPEVMRVLSAYGPVQSKKIQFLNLVNDLLYYFENGNYLVLEQGAFEHLVEWKSFIEIIDFKEESIEINSKNNYENLTVGSHSGSFTKSATSLQTYYDCARKYYYNYIEKIDIHAKGIESITPDLIGQCEHKIIEEYVKESFAFDENLFNEKVNATILKYIDEKEITEVDIVFKQIRNQITANTKEICQVLLTIKEEKSNELLFEVPVKNFNSEYKGSVDLIIKNGDTVSIFDFKRSASSIPTTKDFIGHEKFQLWLYSLMASMKYEVINIGYINLSELDKSLVFSKAEQSLNKNLEQVFGKVNLLENMDDELFVFKEKLEDLLIKIENDNTFKINPKSSSVCTYCVANSVCSKKTMDVVDE